MNTKDKRPYKTMRLTDRQVPTWVIHGGPVHIAAFWSSESDAMYRCKELNDVHEAALAELDKAPKVLTVEEAINAVRDCYAAMGWTQHHEESELRARLAAAMEAKTRKS